MIDIKFTGIDGYEATQQIRHFIADVVIIAKTTFALTGDREWLLRQGDTSIGKTELI